MDAAAGLLDDAELAALRDALAALGTTAPRLVYRKTLSRSDVDMNQMRLLVPCLRGQDGDEDGDARALTAFLTVEEKARVREVHEYRGPEAGRLSRHQFPPAEPKGMGVAAYDRHGRRFDMRLKKTPCNIGYRFFGNGWGRFLRENQLAEAMAAAKEMGQELEVELWAFRSSELPPPERRSDGDNETGGALGVAILIRNQG